MRSNDKCCAERRTPEAHLLAISLIGCPAQQIFRHNSSRCAFYYLFRGLALLQLGVFGWIVHMHNGA